MSIEQYLLQILLKENRINQQQTNYYWQMLEKAKQTASPISLSSLLISHKILTQQQFNRINEQFLNFINYSGDEIVGLKEAIKDFKNYQILGKLGQGGMGAVYKAYDNNLDRTIALKVVSEKDTQQKHIQRFFLEAKSTAQMEVK